MSGQLDIEDKTYISMYKLDIPLSSCNEPLLHGVSTGGICLES